MPYGMHAAGLIAAINDVYAYLHAVNVASVEHGYGRLEELMQKAGFSGLLSQSGSCGRWRPRSRANRPASPSISTRTVAPTSSRARTTTATRSRTATKAWN